MTIRRIVILALLASILFVQEQLLSFLPNIQLTIMLILLYSKTLKFKEVFLILILHVCLDNLINGSFVPFLMISMFIGYLWIPIITNCFLKNVKSPLILASFGIIFSILYTMMFLVTNVIVLDINFFAYLISDIPFTLFLIASSFLSILWIFPPLKKLLDNLLLKDEKN